MININIDNLKFYLDPTMENLESLIEAAKECFIEEYGEEYREKINTNTTGMTGIFVQAPILEREKFTKKFLNQLILSAYQPLAEAFHLTLPDLNGKRQDVAQNSIRGYLEKIKIKFQNYNLIKKLLSKKIALVHQTSSEKRSDNFIEKALKENNIYSVLNDKDLGIFRSNIREYLEKAKTSTQNQEELQFLEQQIKYIDDTAIKFDKIMEVLKPKMELIKEKLKKKEQIREALQKEYIQKHDFMLSEREKAFIKKNPNYRVSELLNISTHLQQYIGKSMQDFQPVFSNGQMECFKKRFDNNKWELKTREEILKKMGIDIRKENLSLQNGDACLRKIGYQYIGEDGIKYVGLEALEKNAEEIQIYNKKWEEQTKDLNFMLSSEEIKQRLVQNLIPQFSDYVEPEKLPKLADLLQYQWENGFISGGWRGPIVEITDDENKTICHRRVNPIIDVFMGDLVDIVDGCLVEAYLDILIHELGHVVASSWLDAESYESCKSYSGIHIEEEYRNLNELMNEYMAVKVMDTLIKKGIIKDEMQVKHVNNTLYFSNFFLLEPFVLEYESDFKKATIENNINILKECLTPELFQEYVNVVNHYYEYQSEWQKRTSSGNFLAFFEQEQKYIEQVKEQLNEILTQVKEKKHNSGIKIA